MCNLLPALVTNFKGSWNGKQNLPAWSGNVYGQYDTQPLFGDAYLSLRTDAIFTGKAQADYQKTAGVFINSPDAFYIQSFWTVNGRVALRDIDLGGVKAELALWGRNLFDTQRFSCKINLSDFLAAGNYIPARSYGMDLTVSF